ncbi:hypothetical protein H5187_23360 [Pseudoalteromonas sp. SG44-1]|uniref:hypothetical protein n=1 Tax=Pseudoalteromonas sp. SG44-1 TaxID=2760964 RepID=UPI0016031DF6|nr:hypothetical protein [Pseudoalteromonas sp. SG44-1]MBB1420155.1 hypothetical protein [Pseudoalteromonas sp. SG44-1]
MVKQLDEVTPQIDQGVRNAANEIGNRVNKALDELEPPKWNDLKEAQSKKFSNSTDKIYSSNLLNNRKIYKNDLDFTSEIAQMLIQVLKIKLKMIIALGITLRSNISMKNLKKSTGNLEQKILSR